VEWDEPLGVLIIFGTGLLVGSFTTLVMLLAMGRL
jgi:hypothetical protein